MSIRKKILVALKGYLEVEDLKPVEYELHLFPESDGDFLCILTDPKGLMVKQWSAEKQDYALETANHIIRQDFLESLTSQVMTQEEEWRP